MGNDKHIKNKKRLEGSCALIGTKSMPQYHMLFFVSFNLIKNFPLYCMNDVCGYLLHIRMYKNE